MNGSAWILLLSHSLRMLACLSVYLPWPIPCLLSLFIRSCGVVGKQYQGEGSILFFSPHFRFVLGQQAHSLISADYLPSEKCVEEKFLTDQSFISILFLPYRSFNMLYLTILPSSMSCPLFHHKTQLYRKAWINWRTWKRIGLTTLLLRLVAKKIVPWFPFRELGCVRKSLTRVELMGLMKKHTTLFHLPSKFSL